jgi:short-subunit dehydrogenase
MNIIITGASRGIGYELAKQFASMGNHNIVAISRDANKLKELKSACIRENIEAHLYPIPFDLATEEPFELNLLPAIKNHLNSIDILVNNAGYLVNKPLTKLSSDELWQMMRVNFGAPARLITTLIPLFKPGGHVVNISSMGGFQGSVKFAGLSVYSASKAALACLTECLAEEMKDTGVAFNCLALGAVNTEMLTEAFPGYKAPVVAKDMASFIANFALNGAKLFNGKVLPVTLSTP